MERFWFLGMRLLLKVTYRLRKTSSSEINLDESSSSEDELTLTLWDKWFKPSDDEFGDQIS